MRSKAFRFETKGRVKPLGPLEAEIMEVLWTCGEQMIVSDVVRSLAVKGRQLSHSAVKAVLNNLTAKHLLDKTLNGNATAFRPRVSKADFDRNVIAAVLAGLRRNYGAPVVAHLVGEMAEDPEFLDQIERAISQKRRSGDDRSS